MLGISIKVDIFWFEKLSVSVCQPSLFKLNLKYLILLKLLMQNNGGIVHEKRITPSSSGCVCLRLKVISCY